MKKNKKITPTERLNRLLAVMIKLKVMILNMQMM